MRHARTGFGLAGAVLAAAVVFGVSRSDSPQTEPQPENRRGVAPPGPPAAGSLAIPDQAAGLLRSPALSPEDRTPSERLSRREDIRRDFGRYLAEVFPDDPRELVERRDAYSRHYRNNDGTVTARISPSPIHYRAEDGSWQAIETVLRQEVDPGAAGTFTLANRTNLLVSRFANQGAGSVGTWIGPDEQSSYRWRPESVGFTDAGGVYHRLNEPQFSPAIVDREQIEYPGIFPGATDRYRVGSGLVKHDFILEVPPEWPAAGLDPATFDLVGTVLLAPGTSFEMGDDFATSSSAWILDDGGRRIMRLAPPFAREVEWRGASPARYRVRPLRLPHLYELRIQVPAAWLLDPERRYPVEIDPTTWTADGVKVDNSYDYDGPLLIVPCIDTGIAWSSWGNIEIGDYGSDPGWGGNDWYDCAVGDDDDGCIISYREQYRSAVDWNTTSVTDGADVLQTRVQIYVSGSLSGTDFGTGQVDVEARNMALTWEARTSASAHYNDCGDGAVFFSSYTLTQGQALTPWIDISTSANSIVASQLAANWFGLGMREVQSGSRGVITWLDFSPLEVTYNMPPTTPGLVSPIDTFRNVGNSITFNWSASSDPELDPITYQLACDTSNPPATVIYSGGLLTYAWSGPVDATTYYWRVRAYDGTSYSAWSAVRWFRENGLPALPTTPITPPNGAWVQPSGSQTVAWTSGGADPDGDAVTYDWQVDIQNPPTAPYTSSGSGAGTTSSAFGTIDNTTYYWRVRVNDGYELTAFTAPAWSFSTDGTAPLPGTVNDGLAADIDYQTSTTTISANWIGFNDPQSGIVQYEWAIGIAPGGTTVQGWTNVGLATSATNAALGLASGTTYYVTVRATNGSGLIVTASSDGVMVDTSPPAGGLVNDGPGADIDIQTSNSTISANWSGFSDPESLITGYQWAIGIAPGGTTVQGWVGVGLSTSATNASLALADGQTYFVTVRATNGAGLTTDVPSDGVLVDGSPPVAGAVNDGLAADVDFQPSLTTISANWPGWSDPHSGITLYEWAIGTTSGGTDIQPFTGVGVSTNATNAALALADQTIYYVTVRATNGAGLTTTLPSDGVTTDATPPTPGTANDGTGADIDWQNSATTINANWTVAGDPTSGIAQYEWAIGIAPGGTTVQGWTSVGLATSATNAALGLIEGTTYFVTVRATNGAGLTVTFGTDGVTVDLTAPGAITLLTPVNAALVTTGTPNFTWTAPPADPSGITYEHQLDNNGVGFPSPDIITTGLPANSYTPATPIPDWTYGWRVRGIDGAGNIGPWSAPAFSLTIDTGPPAVPMLISPPNGSYTNASPVPFDWTDSPDPSGVTYTFEVIGVSTQAGLAPSNTTAALGEGTYTWRVNAVDGLGQTSAWSEVWTVTVDTTPPPAPILTAPPNGSMTGPGPLLQWQAVADAVASYQVELDGSPLPAWNTSLAVGPLLDGVHSWRVRAFDLAGNTGAWSVTWTFTVDATPPTVPLLFSPADGSTVTTPNPVLLTWQASTDASGVESYDISVMGASGSVSGSPAGTSWSTTIPDGPYTWRVRATDIYGNKSGWSATWSFTKSTGSETTPPTAPNLLSPGNNATVTTPLATLWWSAATDASGIAYYTVQVDDNEFFTFPLILSQTVTALTTNTPGLPNGDYWWRVRAVDTNGNVGPWSVVWKFTLADDSGPPSAPVLLLPLNGSTWPSMTIPLDWTDSTDDVGVASYDVELSLDGSVLWTDAPAASTTTTPSLNVGTYSWRVRAIDAAGNQSTWSEVWVFAVNPGATLDGTPPSAPVRVSPPDGTPGIINPEVTLTWTPGADAQSGIAFHEVEVYDFTPALVWSGTVPAPGTGATTSALIDGVYTWRVRAVNGVGLSTWAAGPDWTFTVESYLDVSPPAAPVLMAPPDGAWSPVPVPFEWYPSADDGGIDLYQVQIDTESSFSTPLTLSLAWAATQLPVTLADGTYSWRVRAIDYGGNTSTWSEIWEVKVDGSPPPQVQLSSPADGATVPPVPFVWLPAIDASGVTYTFEIVAVETQVGLSAVTTTSSVAGGTYTWRVFATDGAGNVGPWSDIWTFTRASAPPSTAPTLIAPANGGCVATLSPTFQWTAASGFPPLTYTLTISGIGPIPGLTGTSQTVALPADGTYTWNVTAVDGLGTTAASSMWTVKADTTAPAAFTLASPASGTTTNDSTPTVGWTASSDVNAFSYVVEFDDDPAFGSPALLDGAPSTATSYTPPVALADGTYNWRISAVDCAGNTKIATNAPFTLTIDSTPPSGLALVAPANGATVTTGMPAFEWTAATGAAGYTWEIATSSSFTGATTVSTTATTHTPATALAAGTWYWRVTAADAAGNSTTTGAWTVTVSTGGGAGAPTLVSPANNSSSAATQVNLTWQAPTGFGAVSYYVVQVDTDAAFASPVWWTSNTAGTVLSTPILAAGDHWWRVQAVSSSGTTSPWSATWKFSVTSAQAPAAPELVSPANSITLKGPTINLVWTQSLDASGDPAASYYVEVLSGAAIAWSGSPTTTTATTGSLANGTYTWHVRATDQWNNVSSWSSTWSFTVDSSAAADTTAPAAVTLVKPADGSTWQVRTLDFEWTSTTDPTGVYYTIEIAAGATVIYAADTSGTTITYGTLPDDTYTWRARATDGAGNAGAWSSVWDFTVNTAGDTTAPSPPTLVSPANNSTVSTANVTLTWQPGGDAREVAYYEVVVDGQSSFTAPLAHQIYPSGTTTTLPFADGTYYWRARAYDWNDNTSPWSATWSFTLGTSTGGGGDGTTTVAPKAATGHDGSRGPGCLFFAAEVGDATPVWLGLVALLTLAAAALARRAWRLSS